MFSWWIFRAVWKGRGGGQELTSGVIRAPVEVPSTHLFDQCFYFKHISLFYAPIGAFFLWYPPFLCYTRDFTCRSGVNLNPCISATNQNFEKWKKWFLIRVVGMYHKNFKHLPWIESIEVARPTICGFDNQKSAFRVFFLRFSQKSLKILKNKRKVLLTWGLRNLPQIFQPSAINKKYRCGQTKELVLLILLAEVG